MGYPHPRWHLTTNSTAGRTYSRRGGQRTDVDALQPTLEVAYQRRRRLPWYGDMDRASPPELEPLGRNVLHAPTRTAGTQPGLAVARHAPSSAGGHLPPGQPSDGGFIAHPSACPAPAQGDRITPRRMVEILGIGADIPLRCSPIRPLAQTARACRNASDGADRNPSVWRSRGWDKSPSTGCPASLGAPPA